MKKPNLSRRASSGIGSAFKLLLNPVQYIADMQAKFPAARWFQAGSTLVPMDPVIARELLPIKDAVSKRSKFIEALSAQFPSAIFFLPQANAIWRKMRKPLNDVLVQKPARDAYIAMFQPIIDDWLSSQLEFPFGYTELKQLMSRLIVVLVNGKIPMPENFHEQLFHDFEQLVGYVGLGAILPSPLASIYWWARRGNTKLESVMQRMTGLVQKAGRRDVQPGPFLAEMIARQELMTEEIIGNLLSLQLAASDTTPVTLGWVLSRLAADFEYQEAITPAGDSTALNLTILNQMQALDELLNQVMIDKVVFAMFSRHAEADITLSTGEIIPAGYDINIPLSVLHSGSATNLGFGAGATKCPGGPIAFDIMKLMVAMILSRGGRITEVQTGSPQYLLGLVKPVGYQWQISYTK